jgi:hypothetical protein
MEHLSQTYTYSELKKILKDLGISSVYATALLASNVIPHEKVGKAYLYSFNTEPIHRATIENLYLSRKVYGKKVESESPEEKSINHLQSLGYQIRKPIGFDIERFKKENPVLFKKYLKYEVV